MEVAKINDIDETTERKHEADPPTPCEFRIYTEAEDRVKTAAEKEYKVTKME